MLIMKVLIIRKIYFFENRFVNKLVTDTDDLDLNRNSISAPLFTENSSPRIKYN
jgi:hypothetical protein